MQEFKGLRVVTNRTRKIAKMMRADVLILQSILQLLNLPSCAYSVKRPCRNILQLLHCVSVENRGVVCEKESRAWDMLEFVQLWL